MKDLLLDIGHLIALKKINRDKLALEIGTTRQNLISAVKGRRPLPTAHVAPLRRALGLDEEYHLVRGQVHGLIVARGEKQREALTAVLGRFLVWPLNRRWFLRGVGEDGLESFAYVFEDQRGVLLVVRNDDALLAQPAVERETNSGREDSEERVLFTRASGVPEREMPLARFNGLFSGEKSGHGEEENLRAVLRNKTRVWTWARLRNGAEQMGIDAEQAARRLGLTNS